MTSFYGSVNGGQGGSGEGIDTSTLMQKNNPTFNGTITGPNARFTGTVQIPEPTEDNHAATKSYVDAALADVDLSEVTTKMDAIETAQDELAAQLDDKVDAENPAFTGTATLNGKNIATVDQIPNISDLPYLDENNPTYTGTLTGADATFSGVVSVPTPTQDGQAVNKQYVDQAIDGVQTEVDLSEVQADIAELRTVKLDKANPTYTGSLTGENAAFSGTVTVATPAAEGEAANKGYVDAAKTELEGDINTLQQTVANQTETINTLNQQVTNITGGTVELPYLKNTGDSGTGVYDFTGATVNAADPVDNSNVATKHYVDQKIASSGGAGEVVSYTQGDGISISPENEISLSIDSAGANGLKVGTNGLGLDLATTTTSGAMAASDKTAIASNTTEITNIKNGTTELPYLKETNPTYEGTLIGGDATFTGSVQISTPDQDNEAANKSYVDTALAEAKSYTDNAVSGIASDETIQQIQSDIENIKDGTTVLPYLSSAGGTVTGPIKYGTSPKDTSDLANKAYVDAIHVQAVADAKNYTDSEITNLENGTAELPYIKNNGDTITGSYDLTGAAVAIAEPTENSNPATKKYVDDSISAIDVSEQIAPLTERVAAAEGEIDTLQTDVEAVETSVTNITSGTTELPYIKDTGDTVTGTYNFTGANVTVAEPTLNNNPATKNYVDTKIASVGGSGEVVNYTQGNGINISPENIISVVIVADNANGLAVDTNGIKLDVATPTTAGAMSGADKAKLDASSTTEQMNQAISSAIDETLEDPTKLPFVNINGDTMHGSLTTTELFTDFVTIRNAGTDGNTGFQNNSDTDHIRVYDKVANTLVPIEVGEPVNNQDASTKKYVDDKVTTETAARTEAIESLDEAKADKNNPTFTGIISGANATLSGTLTGNTATFSGGITVPLEPGAEGSATSKKYVDDQIAAIDIEPLTQRVTTAEGEIDTLQSDMTTVKSNVGTINTNITNITNGTTELPYIPSDGGTISGPINWGGNPQEATELANKAYVDANDSDTVNSAKEYTNAQIEIAKGYTDEAVTNLTNGTTKLPYVTKEEVEIAADTRDVARAYRYTFNDGLDGTNSNAGFGFIDFTPAIVTEVDGSTSFSPLYIGEPEKDSHAATKKYVDDKAGNYLPLAGGTMTGPIDAGENTVTNLKEPEEGTDATTKNYVDGEVAKAAPVSVMPIPKVEGQNLIIVDDSVEWPLQGLKVYGKSTQVGNQLLPLTEDTYTTGGLTATLQGDGSLVVNGTPQSVPVNLVFFALNLEPGTYYVSGGVPTSGNLYLCVQIASPSGGGFYVNQSFTITGNETSVTAMIQNVDTTPLNDYAISPMINRGNSALPIQKYAMPTPESPIPITSAGGDGNVDVSMTGKNLLNISKMQQKTTNGITFSLESGGIKINGTATANTDSPVFTFRLPAGTYISNISRTQFPWLSSVNYVVEEKDGSLRWLDADVAFTVLDEDIGKYFYFAVAKGKTVNKIIYPQLELGSVSTDYEPYKSQSLTISTPNGLPGIPVDSGGNYIDAERQQWVCDAKDYGTGKYTQMVGHIESYNGENITTPYMSTTGQLSTGAEVYYVLDEPVVTDVSTEELAAYRALHTYDGTTVISTDEDIAGLKVKYVAKAIDYQQSINAAIQEANNKIDAVYNSLVKRAETIDEVNQLFKDWWNANWEDGSSTYNDMLERWFGKVLDDDKVYGVKLPLFETSTSPRGEYIEDSVGAIVIPATEEDPGQNDFAKTPQFWCVEVAAEKNADGSHTIYACEYIDDIDVVRNGGPDNGKHLVWVLQKNTYVREYEESGYAYIKIQCHPAEGFVQWPQGTDRTGHTYSYIANPKYAAGIEDDGSIGCRTGLKPTSYMSMNQTIQAWRARGPQYSGSSACFYKWAYIMFALLTAKKGENVGCNNYYYQYAAAVSESGVSRIILPVDQANNLYVGSNVIIGDTEGNNDRSQAAMYSLVNSRRISSIEKVIIEEDASSYKAIYIDVPEGITFDTTAGTTYISTMPFYSGWTDTVKGTIGTKFGTNFNNQPCLLQKVELMNGAYSYASDELDEWSQQDDTHYLYSFYLCEDQTKVSTNGTITDDYVKKENATLTIDTAVYTTNNSWYYIEDNLTDNNFKMLNPKKFSTSAGSGTGTRDAFYLNYAAAAVKAPMVWGALLHGGNAGLSCRDLADSPSWAAWNFAGGCPGLSG